MPPTSAKIVQVVMLVLHEIYLGGCVGVAPELSRSAALLMNKRFAPIVGMEYPTEP